MKPITQTVNQTLATLGSLPTRQSKGNESLPLSPREISRPCRTDWQRKWLKLDCHSPRIQELADSVQAFCLRYFRNDASRPVLVLVGESGCGKSHVAKRAHSWAGAIGLNALVTGQGKTWKQNAPWPKFVAWPEMSDAFKAGDYSGMDDMLSADLLTLDDIGAEHDPSKSAANKLCQVLSRRDKRHTIITTNITPENWPERFDSRIADRLMRHSEIVNLVGVESYALAVKV